MKKIAIAFLAIFISLSLFADSGNYQKIYPIESEIYDDIVDLYLLSGMALPSSSGPYSGQELLSMVERVDYEALTEFEKSLYDSIEERLDEEAFSPVFDFNPYLNIGAYISTNNNEECFQGWDNWFYQAADNRAALELTSEEHVGDSLYGFINFSLGVAKTHSLENQKVGNSLLWTNIPMLFQNDIKQLDFNFPMRAFVAAGGENFSLQIGRERLSWGPGQSGNYIIGDHIDYHNVARVAAFDDGFKYTFVLLGFPHPQNYYFDDGTGNGSQLHVNGSDKGQSAYVNGISMFIAHRMEWRLFNDKVGFTVNEGIMYMSKDNKIDLTVLSPAHVFHNSYVRSLTNSILGFEVDYTPFDGLNIYAQAVVDEMFLPGEPVPGDIDGKAAEPTAMGIMVGATYKRNIGNGILTINGEFSKTDPYLYLRDADQQIEGNPNRTQREGDWGINYVVALREMIGAGGTQFYDEQFLGYRYGGDAIVADLSATYRVPSKYSIGTELFYMAHGTHDRWTVWTRVNNVPVDDFGNTEFVENSSTPTTSHITGNHKDPNAKLRDSISHSFVLALRGGIELGKGLSFNGELDWLTVINPGNLKANGTKSTIQMVLGATWAI